MVNRLLFAGLTLFWLLMNLLLWQREFGSSNGLGSSLPPRVVGRRILTAPDNSALDIWYRGHKVGFCRWSPKIGQPASTQPTEDNPDDQGAEPEGMVLQPSDYEVLTEGHLLWGQPLHRFQFSLSLRLTTNYFWRELTAKVSYRAESWKLHAKQDRRRVNFEYRDHGRTEWARSFSLDDLQNPHLLLGSLGIMNLPPGLLPGGLTATEPHDLSLDLQWEARNDRIQFRHTQLRVFRLQTRLGNRYRLVVLVSRAGELLRVELPDGLTLINEAVAGFKPISHD